MTSPHNPSGRRTSHAELARLSDLCAQRGATLLVDEIFADYGSASPADAMGGRAQRASPAIVSVSGLSKAYGLGSLRVGWLVAAPPLVERATHVLQACLADLPVAQLCLAAHAFSHLPALAAEREREAADQRRLVSEWIAARPHLSWHEPDHVPYGLVRVRGGYDLTSALERGVRSHGVLAVPGAFFGMEDTFRLGFAMEPARLACALGLLDRVLDDFARCRSPITPSAA